MTSTWTCQKCQAVAWMDYCQMCGNERSIEAVSGQDPLADRVNDPDYWPHEDDPDWPVA